MVDDRSDDTGTPFDLAGMNAVVTGGAAGIGKAVALSFAAAGAHVTVAGIGLPGLQATVDEIAVQYGAARAVAVQCDISDSAAVVRMFDAAQASAMVDIVANVAGLSPRQRLAEITPEDYARTLAVNAGGTFLCLREAILRMRQAGRGGTIVNVSSVASLRPAVLHQTAYAASKAAIDAMTRALALECGPDGIRINSVLPGGIPGERTRREAGNGVSAEGPLADLGRIPLRRYGHPSEVANAVLFLASPAASYITGHSLVVDGGFLVG